jgi:hypothetical protein
MAFCCAFFEGDFVATGDTHACCRAEIPVFQTMGTVEIQAATSGLNYIPDRFLESHDVATTIRDVACRYLAEDRQGDPNCPSLRPS